MNSVSINKFVKFNLLALTVLFSAGSIAQTNIAVVEKVTGIPWFKRMDVGVNQAAKDLNIHAYSVGASTPDPAQQVKIIEDLIAKKVDGIVVVPNDAKVLQPVIKKARDAGIVVITNEAPGSGLGNWDIETIDNKKYAQENMDALAKSMGEKGGYAIYVGSLTVPLHNTWADLSIKYQKQKYPQMHEVTSRLPVAESIQKSYNATLDLMKTYSDFKGVIGYGSLGPIGAGQAVARKHAAKKVSVVGIAIPAQAAPYLSRGDIKKVFLWDPKDAGYAAVAVANMLIQDKKVTDDLTIKGLGKASIDHKNRVIRFDKTLVVTKKNARTLGF